MFSADYPKNYLVVHGGQARDFYEAKCFELEEVDDVDAAFSAPRRLGELLRERLPILPPCEGGVWPRLSLRYTAGYGVSLHGTKPSEPRSGFAFITLLRSAEERRTGKFAHAEWQYWRGGSAELVLQWFVFDLTNLYVNGLVKPVP